MKVFFARTSDDTATVRVVDHGDGTSNVVVLGDSGHRVDLPAGRRADQVAATVRTAARRSR